MLSKYMVKGGPTGSPVLIPRRDEMMPRNAQFDPTSQCPSWSRERVGTAVSIDREKLTSFRLPSNFTTKPYSCSSKQCIRTAAFTKTSVSILLCCQTPQKCASYCFKRLIVCFSAAHTFDSDDDEDSVPEIDADTAYRRSAELLFSSDLDEERSMAAMRGALAAGKRVPSKDALASLEVVKVEDLEDNGRSKTLHLDHFTSGILTVTSMHHLLQRIRRQ